MCTEIDDGAQLKRQCAGQARNDPMERNGDVVQPQEALAATSPLRELAHGNGVKKAAALQFRFI